MKPAKGSGAASKNLQGLVRTARTKGPRTLRKGGRKTSVVLSAQDYQKLLSVKKRSKGASELAALVDHFSVAVILLNESGKVLHINGLARKLLKERGCLEIRKGRVFMADSGKIGRLEDLTCIAVPGPAARGLKMLARCCRAFKCPVLVASLSATNPSAALMFCCTEERVGGAADLLGALYKLTPSELRVFRLLAQGLRPEQAAREIGVSVHTVRNHLKAIFFKTRVSSQNDLIRLVLSWPIASA